MSAEAGAKRSTARHALGGLGWSGLSYGSQGVGQFAVVAVLARYLTPQDFGVVTAALILVALGQLFTESGVGPAVVQRPSLTRRHTETAFTLAVASGALMTAVVWVAAPLAARFFKAPEFTSVMHVLAFTFVIESFAVVPQALLQRELRFRALGLAESASFCLGFAGVGVACAIAGLGVWSLVAAQLAQSGVLMIIVTGLRPHPRSLRLSRGAARELLVFGGGLTIGRVLNYAALWGDNTVVGRAMSTAALGIYGRAYQLAVTPALLVGQVMDRVIFPVMARFQRDRARVARAYLRGVALVAIVTGPASVLAVVLGREIIGLLLGSRWGAVVAPFEILSIGLVCRTSYKISDSLARATGTVYKRAWRQAVYAVAVVVGALAGSPFGLAWVSAGVLAAIVLNYLLMADLSLRTLGTGWGAFLACQRRGVALAAVTLAVAAPVAHALRAATASELVVLAGATAAPGGLLAFLAWWSPRRVLGPEVYWLAGVIRRRRAVAPRVAPELLA